MPSSIGAVGNASQAAVNRQSQQGDSKEMGEHRRILAQTQSEKVKNEAQDERMMRASFVEGGKGLAVRNMA